MATSIRQLIEAECASRYEGVVPEDVMQESWVAQFLALMLDGYAPTP